MERLTINDVEPWLLQDVPVVRFWARDFDQSPEEYVQYLDELGETLGLGIVTLTITEPPAVVVQSYLSGAPPVLKNPLLKVSKGTMAWLYCPASKCRERTAGVPCEAHKG